MYFKLQKFYHCNILRWGPLSGDRTRITYKQWPEVLGGNFSLPYSLKSPKSPIIFSVTVLVCYLLILNKETVPSSRFYFFFIIQYRILIHWKHHEIGPFKPYKPFWRKPYLSLTSYAQRNEISTHRIFSFFIFRAKLSLHDQVMPRCRTLFNVHQILMHFRSFEEAGQDWNCQIAEG